MATTTTTVRLRPGAHKAPKTIAEATGESLSDLLDRAIEDLHRKVYLDGVNADYAGLRRDARNWSAFVKDLGEWDVTNNDGLTRR